jgi:hypothetical protein
LGNNEQLAKHPNFKAGRPGGCENCMDAEITYSTATPQGEIRHLTSFNLSCLTRWRPCVLVEDVLPSSKPFHLHGDEGDPPQPQPPERSSKLCDIPVWALGRDAINVFVVDALSASNQTAPLDGGAYETAHVHLVETVKGSAPWPAGTVLHVRQNFGDSTNPPFTSPEHLMPGHRQLALVTYPFPEFDAKHPPPPEEAKWGPGFVLDRCELLDDTPLNRIELQRGFAQNDHLRVAEF